MRTLISKPFRWLDVTAPTRAELELIANEFKIHPALINDCLDSRHPPKVEKLGDITFIILRGYDSDAKGKTDTVQRLSRKVAIFIGTDFLITVHRTEPVYLKNFLDSVSQSEKPQLNPTHSAVELSNLVLSTFDQALFKAEQKLDLLENKIMSAQGTQNILNELSTLKRHATAIKRVAAHTASSLIKWSPTHQIEPALFESLKEAAENLSRYSEELEDEATHLLSMQLSLASHRTNEIMRVLTLFSVVFMPLTFIVGVYGMNFDFMPELKWQHGYIYVWVLMATVTIATLIWFRQKKWID